MRNIYFYIILPLIVSAVILIGFHKHIWQMGDTKLSWNLDKQFTVKFGAQVGWTTNGLIVDVNESARILVGDVFFGQYVVTNHSDKVYKLTVERIAYPISFRTHIRTINNNIPTQLTMEPGSQTVLFVYGYVDPTIVEEQDPKKIPVSDRLYMKIELYTDEELAVREKSRKERAARKELDPNTAQDYYYQAPL